MSTISKLALASMLCLCFTAATASARDDDHEGSDALARFEGGIGSQPLRAGGAPNQVNGINPGGAPWIIRELSAQVKTDGRISVDGRGLLLGGGNLIGFTANQSVRARLICGGVFHDTGLVALQPNGDFEIRDSLTPLPPNPCTNPVLLILNAGGSWFAAGIPKL
jgi:hypothetical protein